MNPIIGLTSLAHTCRSAVTKPSWRQPHEALICILDHCLHTTHNSFCLHAVLSLVDVYSSYSSRMYRMINSRLYVPAYVLYVLYVRTYVL